jgi:hypothetical protein
MRQQADATRRREGSAMRGRREAMQQPAGATRRREGGERTTRGDVTTSWHDKTTPGRCHIRSNTMSHITFKMCKFVLIIHLRNYHYDFDLDLVYVWSRYGVLQLTYMTYQNSCPIDHFFGRLLMSQDISPTLIVLLVSIYRIFHVFVRILPMSQDSIMIMSVFDHFMFSILSIFLSEEHIPRIRIFSCFSSFR